MLSRFRKNFLFLPSACSSSSSSFHIRFPVIGFSSRPLPPPRPRPRLPPPPPPLPYTPMVSVWWDVDCCVVPSGVSFWNVAPSIMAAVRANGIKGDIEINAYHRFSTISMLDQETLFATGMELVPLSGGKNDVYKMLLRDLSRWVDMHPPPNHLFLILDDKHYKGFSTILHRLRMNNYNILLACPGRGPDILRSATTIMWQWSSMLKREDLVGKHFNYPPDGPFGSWYGDLNVPLENSFSAGEEPASSQIVSCVDGDSKSFLSFPSQGKPIGECVDGKTSFPSFKESNVHQPPNELEKTSLGSEKVVDVANALPSQVQLPPNDIQKFQQ